MSDSGEALASISAQRHMEPTKLAKLMRGELDWIVMKTLEKDRNRRYETASAFAADVQRYLNDETVQACPPSSWYRFRKFARRNKVELGTAAVVASALCIATIGLAISNVIVSAERNEKIQAIDEKGHALGEKQAALGEKEIALTQAQANYIEAKRHEGLSQINADNAKQQQRVAQEQEILARRRFYAAQMNLALQAWEAGHPARMLQLLESQRPRFDQDDLRGFDWYYLWRLCQGAYRFSLPTLNYDNASAIAISPDGKTLASGYGGSVRLWSVSTGRQGGELTGHRNMVGWLAFAPDGKTLASSYETETVKLWDLATGKQRATLRPGQVVTGVQFAGDSQTLVLGGKHVKLWDVVANQEVATLGESNQEFLSYFVAIASGGTVVAASDHDEVRIWVRDGSKWHEFHVARN